MFSVTTILGIWRVTCFLGPFQFPHILNYFFYAFLIDYLYMHHLLAPINKLLICRLDKLYKIFFLIWRNWELNKLQIYEEIFISQHRLTSILKYFNFYLTIVNIKLTIFGLTSSGCWGADCTASYFARDDKSEEILGRLWISS